MSEALDSLLQQTYQNWEAIVVNDGSPDDTENVALGYVEKDKRIKYLCEENAGPSSARNMGIKYAKGEFILPLDADDLIKPEYIEIAIDTFDKNPSIKLVYCQGFFFGDTVGLWDLRYSGYKNLLLRNAIFSSAFLGKVIMCELEGMTRICAKDMKIGIFIFGSWMEMGLFIKFLFLYFIIESKSIH